MPPRDTGRGLDSAKPSLRQRVKDKLSTHRTKCPSKDHEPPLTRAPHPNNDADRNESPPVLDPKVNPEGPTSLIKADTNPCEGNPQAASVNDGTTDQEPKDSSNGVGLSLKPTEEARLKAVTANDQKASVGDDKVDKKPRDLWSEAFSSLKPAEQAQLKAVLGDDQASIFGMPDFDNLKAEVLRKQNECEEKAWTVNVGDHVIIVRDLAAKSATWLQKLGDLAIPFAPTAASAPWGLVKGVLQIPISYDKNMVVLLASLEDTLQVIYHGHLYEALYTPEQVPSEVLDSLHSELLVIYKSALELIAYTKTQINHGTVKHVLEAFINPDGVGGPLADLKGRHADLSRAAQLCESHRSADADNRLIDAVRGISGPLVRFEERCEVKFKAMEDEEMIRTLHAISSIPYTSHHQRYQEERTPGTCEWLMQDDVFRSWGNSSSPGVFWLWGMPGVGKSFLTSKVIDHFQDAFRKTPNHEGLAFFYCRRAKGEDERSRPLSVLQSFLRQLACYVNKPELIQLGLVEAVQQTRRIGGSFDRAKCEDLLLKSFDLYPCTTLIIDALDECDADSRRELIRFLSSISTRASRPVKIFISSRPDDDIKRAFSVGFNVGVHASMTEEDMRLFINQKLEVMKDNFSIKRMRSEISIKLFKKCDGMFQWANLQLDQLKRCTTRETIEARLNSLPTSLKEAYDEIFDQMEEDDSQGHLLVSRAVMWVMCATWELSSDLLLSAIRVDHRKKNLDLSSAIDEQGLLHLCRHLLVQDRYGFWRVSHLSVTEYFEKNHRTIQEANLWVGNACLLVLIHGFEDIEGCQEPHNQGANDSKDSAPHLSQLFKLYTLHCWHNHVRALNGIQVAQISSMTALLVKFFGSHTVGSVHYYRWMEEAYKTKDEPWRYNAMPASDKGLVNLPVYSDLDLQRFPIFAICQLGIYTALGDWWNNIGDCLQLVNSDGKGLIQLAAEANCVPICERLLRAGAVVDVQNSGASLLSAIEHRNAHLFRVLRTANHHEWNSLMKHPSFGLVVGEMLLGKDSGILQLLCSDDMADGNVELQGCRCGSLLSVAVWNDDRQSVESLVRNGADVNLLIETGGFGSALAVAAYLGRLTMTKYLVQCGADINLVLKAGFYGSALVASFYEANGTKNGTKNVTKYLIEAGADVNLRLHAGDYGSALIAVISIFGANLSFVRFLLETWFLASFPLDVGYYDSSRAEATNSETLDLVRQLVEAGANVNLQLHEGYYQSALVAAIHSVGLDLVRYLVEGGADVNIPLNRGKHKNVLTLAIALGRSDLIEYLTNECGAQFENSS